ncbi:TIGR02281 family clan AA aspartic protease [Arthrospira platensis BEA 1257B]
MNNHSINGKSHFPSLVQTIPITVGLLVVSAAFYPQGLATAQEQPGCFARTRSGRLINLNQICNFPEVVTPPSGTAVLPGAAAGVYQAPIIRRHQGIPVVLATFNDSQPFPMMIDTGVSGTVITPLMAEVLGVVRTGRGLANTPSEQNVEFDLGEIISIEVGGAMASNLTVAIAPALEVGLLGQDFFGQYDVTIREDVIEFRTRG